MKSREYLKDIRDIALLFVGAILVGLLCIGCLGAIGIYYGWKIVPAIKQLITELFQ